MEFANILIIEAKIWGIAVLYNRVTIIIETNNLRCKKKCKIFHLLIYSEKK